MTIDYFFDFISPFGWIGAEHITAIARRFERRVTWHPFLLQVTVVELMGLKPPLETPLKGAYLLHDIKRSMRYHGLSMSDQARFGFKSLAPARAVLWARDRSPERVEDLVLALYRAHWSQGRDISDVRTVLEVVADLGLSVAQAAIALDSSVIKTALRESTASAVQAGVFGSPTVIVDGEMFWGADRLPTVEAWLERGGW